MVPNACICGLCARCFFFLSSRRRHTRGELGTGVQTCALPILYDAPLYKMLGGGEPVITTDITISVDHIDKMVADLLSAVDRGFESLKIKVGKDIGVDIERVRAIYAAVEGRALLRLDDNQGWTAKQAVYAMQALEDAGVRLELLEQTVRAQDIDGLKYVHERVHPPVMGDARVFAPRQMIDLIQTRTADP